MQEKALTYLDKTTWGPGQWQDEPDKVQWADEATGLPCLAVRHPELGNWCGYVGVPEGHPLFGVRWDSCYLSDAQEKGERPGDDVLPDVPEFLLAGTPLPERMVLFERTQKVCGAENCADQHTPAGLLMAHHGVNFSAPCQEDDREHGICHVPDPGEPDNLWWFGFDCGHCGDHSPKLAAEMMKISPDTRTVLNSYETYRTLPYVRAVCSMLAGQLAAIGRGDR